MVAHLLIAQPEIEVGVVTVEKCSCFHALAKGGGFDEALIGVLAARYGCLLSCEI